MQLLQKIYTPAEYLELSAATIDLGSIDLSLKLADIYDRVNFAEIEQ